MQQLVELSSDACRELLGREEVGRVALCTPVGPRILPVNYTVHEDSVFFRTMPYSVLGTYGRDADLALEIDRLDYENHEGWSVVVVGHAMMVDDSNELRQIRLDWDPQPWAGGHRYLYVRLHMREISGRRIVTQHRATPAAPA